MTSLCTLTVPLELSQAHIDVWILFFDRIFQPREVCPVKVEQVQCTGTYCIEISNSCGVQRYLIRFNVQCKATVPSCANNNALARLPNNRINQNCPNWYERRTYPIPIKLPTPVAMHTLSFSRSERGRVER